MKIKYNRNLLVIADAEPGDGLGHIRRTSVLAREFADNYPGRVYYYLSATAVVPAELSRPPFSLLRFPAGLAAGKLEEQLRTLLPAHNIGAVIVDSYKMEERVYRALREITGVALLVIDDTARLADFHCDLLLNYSPLAETLNYKSEPETEQLFGLRYFPVSRQFQRARACCRGRERGSARDLVVTMGGVDPENAAWLICRAVRDASSGLQVKVVLGPGYEQAPALKNEFASLTGLEFIENCTDLSVILSGGDWVITAAGITCWELAYLGIPFLVLQTAPEQEHNFRYIRENGLALAAFDLAALSAECLTDTIEKITLNPAGLVAVGEKLASVFSEYRGAEEVIERLVYRAARRETALAQDNSGAGAEA